MGLRSAEYQQDPNTDIQTRKRNERTETRLPHAALAHRGRAVLDLEEVAHDLALVTLLLHGTIISSRVCIVIVQPVCYVENDKKSVKKILKNRKNVQFSIYFTLNWFFASLIFESVSVLIILSRFVI